MPSEPIEKQGAGGFRLLIVDDEMRLRDMLSRSAREFGFSVTVAASGEQALSILGDEPFPTDILLVDLNLPGMTGLELLERTRQRWPDLQAIVLTGFGSLESAKRAIRLDAVDFLTKPCSLGDLEQALARARERRLGYLRAQAVPVDDSGASPSSPPPQPEPPVGVDPSQTGIETLEEIERRHILAALHRHAGNRAAAAAELGISERTIYYKLGRYQRSSTAPSDFFDRDGAAR